MTTAHHQYTLEQLKPGDHLCCLYETEEEHRALLAPFLRQGLEQGQKVVYIVAQHSPEQILNYLREDGCEVDSCLASSQLSIITPADTYLRDGLFDPDRMIAFLRAETDRTLAEGYPALRVTGEMTWSLEGLPGSERLIEYEAKLNHFFPGSACLAICQYDRRRFPPELLQDVLATHPVAVVGTRIYNNFYYVPPEKFLGPDPRHAVLSCCLENLDERNRVEEELRRSRDEWQLTFDSLSDGITVHDPGYNVIGGNHAFAKLVGANPIGGSKCYKLVHGLDGPPPYCPLTKTLTTRKSESYDFFEPHLGRHLAIRTDPVFADNGEVRRVIHVVRDITEHKRAEQELGKTNAALQSANKELESFVYAVAHDLRAPLRHIDGFSNILVQEYGPQVDPNARRYLELIQCGTQRMTYLLEDLLNLSRIGRQELHRQVCGLNSLVAEVLNELKPEVKNRQIEWRIGQLPFVECDPNLMKQVLTNLLSNALKFTRPRERVVIEVGQTTIDGEKAVFVRDNGVGFSMKYTDKLFGVFQRLHRQEDFEGTGVGLAIVQRIIHKHHGRVWGEAELDKGATFYFTLGKVE